MLGSFIFTIGLDAAPLRMRLEICTGRKPAFRATSSASPRAATWAAMSWLLMSFQVAPAPAGPSKSILLPIAISAGRALSSVAASPPTKNLSSPDAAA